MLVCCGQGLGGQDVDCSCTGADRVLHAAAKGHCYLSFCPAAVRPAGLQPLTPYLIKYLADSVAGSLRSSASLSLLLRLASALLRNEHIGLEPYVHQLLPALLTCVVAKGIGRWLTGDLSRKKDSSSPGCMFQCLRHTHESCLIRSQH
jgi:hypothetical protein